MRLSRKSQSIIEYSVLVTLVAAGILLMRPYVIRGVNAYMKTTEDNVKESMYEPLREDIRIPQTGTCPDGVCDPGETLSSCCYDCHDNSACDNNGDCCEGRETLATCPNDCSECGDGDCNGTENNTPGDPNFCCTDCSTCGDAYCCINPITGDPTGPDSGCVQDCPQLDYCGNSYCGPSETCSTCSSDCGACDVCGDGVCTSGENITSCYCDCHCGNGICEVSPPACPGTCTNTSDVVGCSPQGKCVQNSSCCSSGPPCTAPANLWCQCAAASSWACPGGGAPYKYFNTAPCGIATTEAGCYGYNGPGYQACSWQTSGGCTPCSNWVGETYANCSEDCCAPSACGNGTCDSGPPCNENATSCPTDCCRCGDGNCNCGESCSSCSTDCGICAPVCGDGYCDPTEFNCCPDCGCSGGDCCWPGGYCHDCGGGGDCPPNCGCFLPGTLIAMADGTTKPIEQLKKGDKVLSYDEKKKIFRKSKVTKTFEHISDAYLIINDDWKITPNHPVFHDGEWVEAGKLKVGDTLLNVDGKQEVVRSIVTMNEKAKTYNIEVGRYHSYIAGGRVVHNK